ncbi:MAG: hypothetical protein AABX01_04370 [Candidatus Micrarchaeota archaeon]
MKDEKLVTKKEFYGGIGILMIFLSSAQPEFFMRIVALVIGIIFIIMAATMKD